MRNLTIREAEKRLLSMRKEVLAQNRRLREAFAESGAKTVQDELEPAQDNEPLAVAAEVADINDNALLQIDQALKAIAAGTFGICTDCSGQISSKRLLAYPLVARCLDCQELAEAEPKPRSAWGFVA